MQNANKREYSCYSSSYTTHLHINYFLIFLWANIKKCWYNSIVIGDHSAVSMEIHLGRFEHCSRWTFQPYLLQDQASSQFLENCIDKHFELNTDETTACIRMIMTLRNYITNLMNLIENLVEFSGYKINNSKSVLMFLNRNRDMVP